DALVEKGVGVVDDYLADDAATRGYGVDEILAHRQHGITSRHLQGRDGQPLDLDVVNMYMAAVIALVVRLGVERPGEQIPAGRHGQDAVGQFQSATTVARADDDLPGLLRRIEQVDDQAPVVGHTVPARLGAHIGGGDPNIAELLAS